MTGTNHDRRQFIKICAGVAGGLLVGVGWEPAVASGVDSTSHACFEPNAWVRIDADDRVTVIVDKSEMGQGVTTALPMLVAEELEVDPAAIHVEFALADTARYANTILRLQATGGSTSVRASWKQLREAGAVARTLLVEAAARLWNLSPELCRADNGFVTGAHPVQRISYGALSASAAKLKAPPKVALKPAQAFRVIGARIPRLDTPSKVNGSAQFGIDVRVPGMLFAAIAQAPVFGGKLSRVDDSRAKVMPGVRAVVPLGDAVAVVADTWWQAQSAIGSVMCEWNDGTHTQLSSDSIRSEYRQLALTTGRSVRHQGDAGRALERAVHVLRGEYELPFLAHATMEPMNCTADVRSDRCELWVPTQAQSGAQEVAAEIAGLPRSAVVVHTTYLGGGFGRRSEQDFVAQAVRIAQAVGQPVQLIWSREEDVRHDYYRPATFHVMHAGLDKTADVVAWTHRIVGPSIMARVVPEFAPALLPGWLPLLARRATADVAGYIAGFLTDSSSVEGAADIPYAIDNIAIDYVCHDSGVPVGFWRSVGHSQNAFVVESFIDEIANTVKADPYAFRRKLLATAPRLQAVLDLAAAKSGWGKPAVAGRYRGIAAHSSFGSHVAQVVEVSVTDEGHVRVHHVVCAVDCGIVVNPAIVESQMESAVVFGLSAALKEEVTLLRGRVQQHNFTDYPVLRIDEMPTVDVHIVSSSAEPGGVGEPGVPPIAPALTNAIFAATGRRIRRLPVILTKLA